MRVRLMATLLLLIAVTAAAQDEPPFQLLGQDPVVMPAEARDGAVVTYEIPVYGRGSENAVITCSQPSGSLFRMGPTNVSCVGENAFGDRARGGVYVFVYDAQVPVLSIPSRLIVDTDDPNGAVVTWEASADDAIDGPVPVFCSPASGSRFPAGVTQVDCYAEDAHFNRGVGSFEVVVRNGDDHGTLVIHVPDDITADAASSAGAVVTFEVTASGSDDPNPTITCDPPSGYLFPVGTTVVRCIARDSFGDLATGEFNVTVGDRTAPVISYIAADPNELHPPNNKLVDVTVGVQSSDAIDPMPLCQAVNVTSNQPLDAPGTANYDWQITGPFTLQLRAERTGDDRIYTIHVTCTDDSGNTAFATTNVIVPRGNNNDVVVDKPTTTKKPVGKR